MRYEHIQFSVISTIGNIESRAERGTNKLLNTKRYSPPNENVFRASAVFSAGDSIAPANCFDQGAKSNPPDRPCEQIMRERILIDWIEPYATQWAT